MDQTKTQPNKTTISPNIAQNTPPSEQEKYTPQIIHTMKSDMANAIKKQDETVISIALAEERKKAKEREEALAVKQKQEEIREQENIIAQQKPRRRFLIVVILFIAIFAGVLVYVYILPKVKFPSNLFSVVPELTQIQTTDTKEQQAPVELAPSLISAQTEERFNITKEAPEQIFTQIGSVRGQGNMAGSIKNFYFFKENTEGVQNPISAPEFIAFAGFAAPSILARSLDDSFMVGFYGEANGGATPFIILKVSSYDVGLAGMLEWEKTLPQFLGILSGMKTSLTTTTTKFRDVVIGSNNARILETTSGTTAYTFANTQTVVISGSRTSLETLATLAKNI